MHQLIYNSLHFCGNTVWLYTSPVKTCLASLFPWYLYSYYILNTADIPREHHEMKSWHHKRSLESTISHNITTSLERTISYDITWDHLRAHIAWHHMRSLEITISHDITWHHKWSHDITSDHMTSHEITWHHLRAHDITWHYSPCP